jgi:hypothetical protein
MSRNDFEAEGELVVKVRLEPKNDRCLMAFLNGNESGRCGGWLYTLVPGLPNKALLVLWLRM